MKTGVLICSCDLRPFDGGVPPEVAGDPEVEIRVVEDLCLRPPEEALGDVGAEALVVLSCQPALHERLWRRAARALGIDPHRVAVVKGVKELPDALRRVRRAPEAEAEVIPRALVIGGGVAGIHAALEIAEGGYEVLLLERSPSIGGHMIQLSEVFPTLDCPQCILTPKMVQCAQHPLIDILAYSELEAVEGTAGRFRVTIKRKSPYIDWSKCTGCGECTEVCPVELPSLFDRGVTSQRAVYKPFPQAVPNKHVILKEGMSPCRAACPLGVNPHGYVALIGAGRFEEALKLVLERLPFPGIMGRICTHPCQEGCSRKEVGGALQIRALKRFLADQVKVPFVPEVEGEREGEVAIVGAGPCGLMAAHELRRRGWKVRVFDALEAPGGMLRAGIPPYRLPREVIEQEVAPLEEMGVEFRLGVRVGQDLPWEDLLEGYPAVLIATGAHRPLRLGVEGEELDGVWQGLEFLRAVNLGFPPEVRGRVVVIGGGNTAIDAARTAMRLGAEEVHLFYRRSRVEMPASPEEVEGAEEEGVRFHLLVAPVRILGDGGKAKGVEFLRMRLGEPDEEGRRKPIPLKGTEFQVEADLVIAAIGQAPELGWARDLGLELTERGTLKVDPVTLETSRPGVFAGGDVVTGPRSAVEAMAAGRRAAESIDRLLRGEDLREGREVPEAKVPEVDLRGVEGRPPERPPTLSPEERRADFREVELPFDPEVAVKEAKRCLNCAGCCECYSCESACEAQAIDHALVDRLETYEVGAIVVATGYELLPKGVLGEVEEDPDVLDPLQFERLLCPSGPTGGKVFRPSDGRVPTEVVFIHCCGSRDPEHHLPYCSRVCCMYGCKLGVLYRHAVPEGRFYLFYMDMRTDGKMYEEFYQRAASEDRLVFLRGRVAKVFREGERLAVWGVDTLSGRRIEVACDLVVLALGMVPSPGTAELAELLGVELDETGFFREAERRLRPFESTREGVFLAGCCQAPKDIPECVAQAAGCAAKVMAFFAKAREGLREVA